MLVLTCVFIVTGKVSCSKQIGYLRLQDLTLAGKSTLLRRCVKYYLECWEWNSSYLYIYIIFSNGKIVILVLQLYFKGQFDPSTFKKTNLVPQLLLLGQICPYTDVMLHNTMRLMLKNHRYLWLFSLLHNLHVQQWCNKLINHMHDILIM